MIEKMTIHGAREALRIANDPLAKIPTIRAEAFGFISGWESRQEEIDELKEAYKDVTGDRWDDVVAGRP